MSANPAKIKPIKVIFVERVPWGGGAERVVVDIIRHLDKTRFQPVVFHLYHGAMPPKGIANGIEFLLLNEGNAHRFSPIFSRYYYSLTYFCKVCWIRMHQKMRPRTRVRNLWNSQFICSWRARVRNLWNSQSMCSWRARVRLRTRLRALYHKLPHSDYAPAPVESVYEHADSEVSLTTPSVETYKIRPVDIYGQAVLLAAMVSRVKGPMVLVGVMEEAAQAIAMGLGRRPNAARPYIIQTHAWESYYLPKMYPADKYDIKVEWQNFTDACSGAEAVTSPSRGCRDDLIENFNSSSARTICLPNPVDLDFIQRQAQLPLERPWPEDSKGRYIFVCVGRYDEDKNHLAMFEACQILRQYIHDFYLMCIGDGYYRHVMEKAVEKLNLQNHICLFGNVKNPFPYYRQANTNILASTSESFGLVLVEALACGCVSITTDTFGARDVLDNGSAGFIVPQNSPLALAQAMHAVITQPEIVHDKLQHGKQWIKRYCPEQIIPQWEMLFSHCAAEYASIF